MKKALNPRAPLKIDIGHERPLWNKGLRVAGSKNIELLEVPLCGFKNHYVIASRYKRRGRDFLHLISCSGGVDSEVLGFTFSRHESLGRISRTPSGHKI